MTKIYLFCNGAMARAKVEGIITEKMVGLPVEIVWDGAWDGLRRILKVRCGDVTRAVELGSRDTEVIPWECLIAGQLLEIGLDGWDADGTLRIPTNWVRCDMVKPSVAGAEGDPEDSPAPPELPGGYYVPEVDGMGILHWTASRSDMPEVAAVSIRGQDADSVPRCEDLTVKFASEIGSKDVWTWLKSRIKAGNFNGIFVGDYINVTCKNGNTFRAQVAGINTYKNYGPSPVLGNHIDFISLELWPEAHAMNPVRWNNGFVSGDAMSQFPWTASDLYLWLNSKAGTVPGDTAAPPATASNAVDYTSGGVLGQLPDALAAAITGKTAYLPKRYNASALLTQDTIGSNTDAGKLWIPTEMEVFGTNIFGCGGYGISGGIQYPIFRSKQNQVKYKGRDRNPWWLASAADGKNGHFCYMYTAGTASYTYADADGLYVPVCFRIAG